MVTPLAIVNYPGPYEIRYQYVVSGISHVSKVNCNTTAPAIPGDDPAGIELKTRGGVPVNVTTAAAAWWSLLRVMWNNTVEITQFELWKYALGTFDAEFIAPLNTGGAGNSVSAPILSDQQTLTFRTNLGGSMRLTFLETGINFTTFENPPFAGAGLDAIRLFVVGASNWLIGRDNGYPIIAIRHYGGQNEHIFKRRNRP